MLYHKDLVKKCNRCDINKCLSDFSRNSSRKDGLSNRCKICDRKVRLSEKIKRGGSASLYKNLSLEARERERIRKKKYKREHPEVVAAINRRTNAKRNGISIEATEKETREFMESAKRCLQCRTTDDLTLDHIIPVSWGFLSFHGLDNFQVLCNRCNGAKKNYGSVDFRGHLSESVCSGNMLQLYPERVIIKI